MISLPRFFRPDPFRPAGGPPPQRLGAFFRWCLDGAWPVLFLAGGLSALAGTLEIVSALLLGQVIDAALSAGPAEVFARSWPLMALFVLFYMVLRPLAFGASSAASNILVSPNVMPQVLSRLNRWTLGQSVRFFDDDFAGRIAQKQMQTARSVTEVVSEVINVVAFALASMVGSVAFLLGIDAWAAAGLALWMAVYLTLIRWFLPRIRGKSGARAAARAMVSGQVVDTITNIKTVKLFAHARHEDQSALRAMAGFREKAMDFGRTSALFRLSLMGLAGILPVMLVGGTLLLWRAGAASAGDIAAAGAIAIRIAQMTGWVSMALMAMWGAIGEAEDGMKTLARPHTLTDAESARELPPARGEIRFENVGFSYGRGPGHGGLHGVDLTIAPGERLGIVGASGAGKSTFVSLLLRLYDTEDGRVLIDGQDVRELTQESLRRQIGMVTQETAMFNRSARDNILYGRPDASMEEVIAAARAAEAHGFIEGLRDHMGRTGYDAALGERGVKLSGGQRQRIALARAFLKDAPILVLDEATSALDSEVEAAIQQALHRIMEGKTVLAIAHRLSTIAAMDRIVVLDQGRIAEIGSHAELLAADGLYARFWARQSGGFLGTDDDDRAGDEG
ncbi:ABC transporter ATP-binding protein [Phaeovulum vinaykumarii]|uniref:ATP-binding cassette, subfamily B n=1 Tax=Phaeovulum vinaykumarii TaxID=407234 RepID=A0A1N7L0C7_9RHOB|nr:ABC transporter ATP-binding protein [Phaeovulum vinaykumarii]SIS67110.1 ATP-binding cassette, subfamily B [Phaeovulum vinaykumarii]SOC00837.1 ATP-binding cassette subfamily B protein [Phaeovulum vinaykumarii]